jgi:hypothetical protein
VLRDLTIRTDALDSLGLPLTIKGGRIGRIVGSATPCIDLFRFVLFCFVLFCFVLFCFVLFCFVLFFCFFCVVVVWAVVLVLGTTLCDATPFRVALERVYKSNVRSTLHRQHYTVCRTVAPASELG